jgi:DNA-binding LacI/PurR family transcriptional regulator
LRSQPGGRQLLIGYITGRLTQASANQRLQGYKDGLEAAGIRVDEELIAICHSPDESPDTSLLTR